MVFRSYLPSAQFTVMVGALALAGGLVYVAHAITAPKAPVQIAVTNEAPATDESNWQVALQAIEGSNASTSLPQPPSQDVTNQALQQVQNSNLTETVGQSMLIDLTNAEAQGTGDETTTQDQILSDATAQIQETQSVTYTANDLTIVDDSYASRYAYGNAVISVLEKYPTANAEAVLLAIGEATDNNDPSQLQKLTSIAKSYSAIAHDLLAVPVPQSLAPLHLLIINDFEGMAQSVSDTENILTDPLRGAAAVQQFNSLISEEDRVFTNIAQEFQKDDILFNKSDSGNAWSTFLTPAS